MVSINSQSLSRQRVLIVGCGDIGRRLAQSLPAQDYDVTGLRRQPPMDTPWLRYLACDLADLGRLSALLQDPYDIVVITLTPSERSDEGYYRAYVQGCQQLMAAMRANHWAPRRLLFVSSTAVYAQQQGHWVDEDSPTEPQDFNGRRILEAENSLINSEFNCTMLRFSGLYGDNRRNLLEQVRLGSAPTGQYFSNRIHIADAVRSLVHLIQLPQPLAPIYLVSDSNPTPMHQVVAWLAAALGVSLPSSTPGPSEHTGKRCSNRRLLESGFRLDYASYKEGYSAMLEHLDRR